MKELCHIIYLWNPSIRMLKKLIATRFNRKHNEGAAIGFAYDSLNNDFKILRIVCNKMFRDLHVKFRFVEEGCNINAVLKRV